KLLAERLVDLEEDVAGFLIGIGEVAPHAHGLAALARIGECSLGHGASGVALRNDLSHIGRRRCWQARRGAETDPVRPRRRSSLAFAAISDYGTASIVWPGAERRVGYCR